MSKPAAPVALAIALAVVAVGVSLWRSQVVQLPGQSHPRTVTQQRIQDRSEAVKLYNELPFVASASLSFSQDVKTRFGEVLRSRLGSANTPGTPGSPEQLEQVVEEIEGIIWHRWLGGSPDSYVEFMNSRGYVPRPLGDVTGISSMFEEATGAPVPENPVLTDVYKTVLAIPSSFEESMGTMSGLSVSPDGMFAAFGEYCEGNDSVWPAFESELGHEAWLGGYGGGFMLLFQNPGRTRIARVLAGDCVQHLGIGLVMGFEDDTRFPVLFLYWFDPVAKRWWLSNVIATNMPEDFDGIIF